MWGRHWWSSQAGRCELRKRASRSPPAVADPAAQIREYAISELDHEVMILTERWKLAVNTQGAPYLLFDRVADPEESRNLAGNAEYAKVANELLQFLKPMMIMPVLSLRPAMP